MADKIKKISHGLLALAVFRKLLDDPVISAFTELLMVEDGDVDLKVETWGEFVSVLYENGGNFSSHLRDVVLDAENPYVKAVARKGYVSAGMEKAYADEIALLDEVSQIKDWELKGLLGMPEGIALPGWETEPIELAEVYAERVKNIDRYGYGICAKYHVFTVENGDLSPVPFPDKQSLSDLTGYEEERAKIIANTKALLAGQHANNVLLYGDAGTGKSSSVKAIANDYADQGLRLIEVKKNQLYQIPKLMTKLADDPLKFILFIDDLSFSSNDDDYAALKAILEGSVSGGSTNVAVYATSNRRHLVKETIEDRTGNDLHASDTRQELMSLSARFGLTITFQMPKKDLYLEIVAALAEQNNIDMDEEELFIQAEAYAIRNSGRSPRTAKNFITSIRVANS